MHQQYHVEGSATGGMSHGRLRQLLRKAEIRNLHNRRITHLSQKQILY